LSLEELKLKDYLGFTIPVINYILIC